ncbi:hypothetical protein [Amycolatopsis sp. CA-230715]|uniref:hypothetical protein n=1 Tax=Amycolatopsis sp. CA-230715 TaxID=2745196 RepID=UPI001C33C043|nr:hypothetical protein [Amycolatopsis sp. CA-230715]QWF85789.1 hypothetical protein HUW46_09269 [Amycolatopsis sp. CA-230715]
MALLTAEFATEQALERLRLAVKTGRSAEVVQWAQVAATAVHEIADVADIPDPDADTVVRIQNRVTDCLDSMTQADRDGDTEGTLYRGDLVGDAAANFAVFLKEHTIR